MLLAEGKATTFDVFDPGASAVQFDEGSAVIAKVRRMVCQQRFSILMPLPNVTHHFSPTFFRAGKTQSRQLNGEHDIIHVRYTLCISRLK